MRHIIRAIYFEIFIFGIRCLPPGFRILDGFGTIINHFARSGFQTARIAYTRVDIRKRR
ncbi:hypothetical protein D3C85_1495630 [compost metagenome]